MPPVDIVEEIFTDMTKHTERMVLSPTRWAAYDHPLRLEWHVVKFSKSEKSKILANKKGVYTFVIKPSIADHPASAYLMYVGKTYKQDLRTRFSQYFSEANKRKGRPKIKKLIRYWERHLWFYYAPIDDISKIGEIENKLMNAYLPPMNDEFSGEVQPARKAWL
jgi:hypothetical protein